MVIYENISYIQIASYWVPWKQIENILPRKISVSVFSLRLEEPQQTRYIPSAISSEIYRKTRMVLTINFYIAAIAIISRVLISILQRNVASTFPLLLAIGRNARCVERRNEST